MCENDSQRAGAPGVETWGVVPDTGEMHGGQILSSLPGAELDNLAEKERLQRGGIVSEEDAATGMAKRKVQLSERSSSKVDPLSVPTGEMVCTSPILFWRCHLRSNIYIYHHEGHDCFEVVSVDTSSGTILPRLFLSAPRIFDLNEKSLSKSQTLEMRLKKRSMVKKQRVRFAAEYILANVDAEYQDEKREGCRLFIRKFNGEKSIVFVWW